MKIQLISFLLLNVIHLSSQKFNGYYSSKETSFKDDLNPKSNFNCKTILNIFIKYSEKTKENNYILITDPKENKVFKYILTGNAIVMPQSKYYISAFWFKKCYSQTSKSKVDIIIYYNFENQMTLMLSSGKKSQALKKMVKIRT